MNATHQHLEAMLASRVRETESISAALTAAKAPKISPTRIIRALQLGRLDGAEKELCDEAARSSGVPVHRNAAYIP